MPALCLPRGFLPPAPAAQPASDKASPAWAAAVWCFPAVSVTQLSPNDSGAAPPTDDFLVRLLVPANGFGSAFPEEDSGLAASADDGLDLAPLPDTTFGAEPPATAVEAAEGAGAWNPPGGDVTGTELSKDDMLPRVREVAGEPVESRNPPREKAAGSDDWD